MKTIPETDPDFWCDITAPCFSLLSPEETDLVRASKTQVLFRKGDTLTKQGAFASYVLFVMEGLGRQYIEGDSGKSFNIKIVQPGEFIGLSSVFARNTFEYSTVALTDIRAFLVEKEALSKVVRENGDFAFTLIRRYLTLNTSLFDTLHQVVYRQMNGRMAETLLYIDGLRTTWPEIFQLLTRKDLAEFAGTSVESAVKLLKSFEADGLIELNDRDIRIVDAGRLGGVAKKG
jgi:CRP-like cAMP-binding protein